MALQLRPQAFQRTRVREEEELVLARLGLFCRGSLYACAIECTHYEVKVVIAVHVGASCFCYASCACKCLSFLLYALLSQF